MIESDKYNEQEKNEGRKLHKYIITHYCLQTTFSDRVRLR